MCTFRLRGALAVALVGLALALSVVPPARAAPATVNLTYYYPIGVAGPLAPLMNGLVSDFNAAHPGIHVTPVFAGTYQQTLAKVETGLQAGAPPDVAVLNATALFDLLHLQAIEPVDALVRTGDFYPAFLKNAYAQGHYWSVPFQRSTVVLYYNATAFAQAHLTRPPATWAELVQDARTLTARGRWGLEIGSSGAAYWQFAPFVVESGGALVDDSGTRVSFSARAARAALTFWSRLAGRDKVMPPGVIDWTTAPSEFAAGHAAMTVHSSGSLTAILKAAHFTVGVAFMPANTRPGTITGGGDFYLFKGLTPAKRAAVLTFIGWMTAPDIAARWSTRTGYIGVSPRVYQTVTMRRYLAAYPQALVAQRQLAVAYPEPAAYALNHIYDILDSAIQSVMDGSASPGSALAGAQRQADQVLSGYRH